MVMESMIFIVAVLVLAKLYDMHRTAMNTIETLRSVRDIMDRISKK